MTFYCAVCHTGDGDVSTATLLDECATMLADYALHQRDLGNDSTAAGADAHAYRLQHLNVAQAPAAQGVSSLTDAQIARQVAQDCARIPGTDYFCAAMWAINRVRALASNASVSEPVEQPGGDAARALTDEQITEIASGYADGISFCKGQEWAIAFNACAFGLSRRDFSGDAVREALKIAQVLLKSYGVSHAEIDAALRIAEIERLDRATPTGEPS